MTCLGYYACIIKYGNFSDGELRGPSIGTKPSMSGTFTISNDKRAQGTSAVHSSEHSISKNENTFRHRLHPDHQKQMLASQDKLQLIDDFERTINPAIDGMIQDLRGPMHGPKDVGNPGELKPWIWETPLTKRQALRRAANINSSSR